MSERGWYSGEYKTPGGKLVAVRFTIADGVLRDVTVHGDFFLYPEDVLLNITAALDGAPADLDDEAFIQRIDFAIPEGTEWLGSSPEGLTIAVRRALTRGPQHG